ncbi:DUF2155 domain-containing protein [Neokomagataea tanensis]|uniref:DUF2155 domain-containing protein n=1 Tax=Neokomagataea tanensis TaxID=661191 RepID=A0A4Y6V5B8_9PROT|nr:MULTISPECIES: DUF2155 domain-containing protein [Neokomagataea]QDH24544.1 DUF2155 domain-containing protein [Neokomagataea tanensis]
MMRRSLISLGVIACCTLPKAWGAVGITPPQMYAPQTWQGRSNAVLHVMNRLDAHLETISVPVGSSTTFRTLSISVDACVSRPPSLAADSGALLHLKDTGDATRPAFDGWMLANEPGLAVYGSPLYDVRVVSCDGQMVEPNPGPLPEAKKPVLSGAEAQDATGDGSGGSPIPLAPDAGAPIPLAPPSTAPTPLAPPPPKATAPQNLPPPEATDPGLE